MFIILANFLSVLQLAVPSPAQLFFFLEMALFLLLSFFQVFSSLGLFGSIVPQWGLLELVAFPVPPLPVQVPEQEDRALWVFLWADRTRQGY